MPCALLWVGPAAGGRGGPLHTLTARRSSMPTLSHHGVKLSYDDRGAGKPAFVFIHGWTCDRSFFAPQVQHFSRRHRVVSPDLRGHGQSDKPHGEYPISAYADDIAFLI